MKNISWKKILFIILEILAGLVLAFVLSYAIYTMVVA